MSDNYIAKEEILSFVEELEKRHGDDLITKTVLVTTKCVKDFVMHMPPEDVQPVVHCKDCVYWSSKETRYCNMLKGTFQENDYCSYAERRTDEPQHETRHSTHHSATDAEQVP